MAKNQVQVEIDPNHFFSQPIIFINVTTIYSQVNGTVVVIYKIIRKRFDVHHKTIKGYINGPDKERVKLSKNQQLLASIFLDICSDSENNSKWQQLKAKILIALYQSKPECSVIFLYYLVQTAHRLKNKIFVGKYQSEEIQKLCSAVCPNIEKLAYEPFIRLV